MDQSTQLTKELNQAQNLAVTTETQHVLVLAGAGSGKTRVLTHRLAWFCHQYDLSPYSVLAVTFTNKAAHEMRERLEQLLDRPAQGLWIGTFHGLGHRLLRTHYQEAGLPTDFQILDADDQQRLIKRLAKNRLMDDKEWPPRQLAYWINRGKEMGIRGYLPEGLTQARLDTLQTLMNDYEQYCQRSGLVDFAEILLRCVEMLQNNVVLREHYQRRFRHVLVDEFQDTNDVQYAWLKLLTGSTAFFTVVGDDDQSIYGWRGACVDHIRNFSRDYPRAEVIKLEQNYRSSGHILAAANAVIERNPGRLGKVLWTDRPEGHKVQLYRAFNDLDEARSIAQNILRKRDQGMAWSDCAVLYRSNAQSRVLEEALIGAAIPYRIHGGLRFFDRAEIRTAMAYLRLSVLTDDDTAFERIINMPPRGLGDKTLDTLRIYAQQHGFSLWQAAMRSLQEAVLPPRATSRLSEFLALMHQLRADADAPLHERLEHLLDTSGLKAFYAAEHDERAQNRVENLMELVQAAREFVVGYHPEEGEQASLTAAFLDHVSLEAGEDRAAPQQPSVQLMTLHAAKGLEFPVVFMTGLEDGLFPHSMALDSDQLEEERRLCYVGMTRAQSELYLSYAEVRRLFGSEKVTIPSRFLKELPEHVVQQVKGHTKLAGSTTVSNFRTTTPDPGALQGQLSLGMQVRHPRWGEGTVTNMEGDGAQARVEINFGREGRKWLMMQYARLEPVRSS